MKNKNYDKFLNKALTHYKYGDRCKKDVRSGLSMYRGLIPESELFVFNDGSEKKLLNLKGTIPVKYKGSFYNIPVCFWLLEDYPLSPPMAYVKPTPEMEIRPSDKVDVSGKISLRILNTWKEDPEASLLGVIQTCIATFGKTPPVFSKAASSKNPEDENLRLDFREKLKRKLYEEFNKTKAEIDSLHALTKELLDGQERIHNNLSELENRISEIDSHKDTLQSVQDRMLNALERLTLKEKEGINPDEIVIPEHPLHRQIFSAYAEDASADDVVYFLGEALRHGKIDLEAYLKRVRNISRKQFMNRFIIDRCRQLLGLPL